MKRKAIRVLVGIVVISIVLSTSTILCNYSPDLIATNIKSLYNEPSNSLDYVVIGSSATMRGISPNVIFKEYGLTGNSISVNGADSRVYEYELKEVVSTQKDVVVIVDIDGYTSPLVENRGPTNQWIDSMHKNDNWKNAVFELDKENLIEHIAPLIRYHNIFTLPGTLVSSVKSFIHYGVNREINVERGCILAGNNAKINSNMVLLNECNKVENLDYGQEENLLQFLNLCKKLDLKDVVFVSMPKAFSDEEKENELLIREAKSNYCKEIIESNGYSLIDYDHYSKDCSLNSEDFTDSYHMDINGACKFSKWLGEYLSTHYDFKDKNQEVIDSWNESSKLCYEKYGIQ